MKRLLLGIPKWMKRNWNWIAIITILLAIHFSFPYWPKDAQAYMDSLRGCQ